MKVNHNHPNNMFKISVTLKIFLLGSHTHELNASVIKEEMEKFKICNKVVFIVTDNGANIEKAVKSMQDCVQERENSCRLARMEAAKNKRKEKAMECGKPTAKKAKRASPSRTSTQSSRILNFIFIYFYFCI